jgi:hypothetical protein
MRSSNTEHLLTLAVVLTEERPLPRDGYTALLRLGWPTNLIDRHMCERAFAGLVPRYAGKESWTAYKREWASADSKR